MIAGAVVSKCGYDEFYYLGDPAIDGTPGFVRGGMPTPYLRILSDPEVGSVTVAVGYNGMPATQFEFNAAEFELMLSEALKFLEGLE